MKISQEEIDAALKAWHNCHPANSSKDDMEAILTAAYTVRKQRKDDGPQVYVYCGKGLSELSLDELAEAKGAIMHQDIMTPFKSGFYRQICTEILERQRKEKNKQVVESVSGIPIECGLDAQGRADMIREFNSIGMTSKSDIERAKNILHRNQLEAVMATPSKAPEWDGNASAFDAAMKPKA